MIWAFGMKETKEKKSLVDVLLPEIKPMDIRIA